MWKERADAAAQMTIEDVAVTLGNDRSRIQDYFNKLGEALEALGEFSKAAHIYHQATTLHCFKSFVQSARLHANSGV
jgi:putative heme degradation protein